MSRRIITSRDLVSSTFSAAGPGAKPSGPDDYKEKLIKYIPAEIVAGFISGDLLIHSSNSKAPAQHVLEWVLFGVLLVATPIYLCRIHKVDRWLQWVVSTFAFAIWVFAMGGPFLTIDWVAENRVIGALALLVSTILIPMIDPDWLSKT